MKIYQNSNQAIYKQIASQFKEKILSGELKSGEYLPSIRHLAADLRISVITTMKAYEELTNEGLITSQIGKGYYVNAQNTELIKEQHLRLLENHLQNAIDSARIAGVTKDELVITLKTLLEVE